MTTIFWLGYSFLWLNFLNLLEVGNLISFATVERSPCFMSLSSFMATDFYVCRYESFLNVGKHIQRAGVKMFPCMKVGILFQ